VRPLGRAVVATALAGAVALALVVGARRRGAAASPIRRTSRGGRNLELARLGLGVGGTYASVRARQLFASAERRAALDDELALRSAEQVAERLGNMKGALMKVGQMASYLDDGLPEPVRQALAQLQADAPPMSAELAAEVVAAELGRPPEALFTEWDPRPIAAASIGQVHRAVLHDPATGRERAVAVKVQYPGVGDAIEADLRNTDLLGALLKQGFGGLDPDEMVAEIKERLTEELDYRREATNQARFAEFFRGHPFIHVPDVVPSHSGATVLTSDLVVGASWREALTWDQHQRDLAGEALFRFVFRSLYGFHAFNGDPHPGNYVFHGDGRVSFVDFGLVRYFDEAEMATFVAMVRAAAYDRDPAAFRAVVERAGLLRRGAPVSTADAGAYFSQFYEAVREDRPMTWTKEYASGIVRHTFDRTSPIAQYATVPRAFVFIQRINLGLYALLGDLGATGNYRRLAEELWPFTAGPPSTPLGEAEHAWLAARPARRPA
jgi:predicted unusual protein kinase regulating ubiquinone biosynthesis (AarF/ABC1/UbiB family)